MKTNMHEEHAVDFLKKKYQLAPTRETKKREKKSVRNFLILAGVIAASGLILSFKWQGAPAMQGNNNGIFSPLLRFIDGSDRNVKTKSDDRINILLTGIGGKGHDGPELTDTIMIASLKPSTNQLAFLSIPRDLAVPIKNYGWRKINSVNAYGEQDNPGHGEELTMQAVSSILDEPIDYYVKVDFSSFEYLIDAVEGVDVYVERDFMDTTYPTEIDGGVQTIEFKAGWQHLDGATALKFARSRHGNNNEGSDFARAARQQKIISAVKDKLLSTSTLLNPGRLNQLAKIFSEHVHTNLSIWEMVKLAKQVPNVKTDQIKNFVLDDAPSGPLYSSTINGAYVLLPKHDDWSDLSYLTDHLFDADASVVAKAKTLSSPKENVNIEIQNGTFVAGLANETSNILVNSGFKVTNISNSANRDFKKTVIYDLSNGKKSLELQLLQDYFDADVAQSSNGWLNAPEVIPTELKPTNGQKAAGGVDFLIVLGQNAEDLVRR